jgi:signal transduction histidine kinase/streptogramin lyase
VAPQGLQEFRGGTWGLQPVRDIALAFQSSSLPSPNPVPLYPIRQGVVIFLLPDRLMELNSENAESTRTTVLRKADQTQLGKFLGMTTSRDGSLWVAGERGLAKVLGPVRNLNPEADWAEFQVPQSLHARNLHQPFEDDKGNISALAEAVGNDQKILLRYDGQHWAAEPVGIEKVRRAWFGPDDSCWAATTNTLFQWDKGRSDLLENEDVTARQYFDVALEPGGAFWLATSDGLFRYAPLSWRSPRPLERARASIHCLAADSAGRVWFVTGNSLGVCDKDELKEFSAPPALMRRLQTSRAMFVLKNGTLVIDAGNHVLTFDPATHKFGDACQDNDGGQTRALGLLRDGKLCVQFLGAGASPDDRLEVWDGARFEPLGISLPEKAAGSPMSVLFTTQNGDLWLGWERGTACLHEHKWRVFASSDRSTPESVVAFAELPDGRIWCASEDRVWEFNGRAWAEVRRGFDRISAILRARDGSIWVASNSGLHRFLQASWIENGVEEGLPAASIRSLTEDQNGRVWAGTTHGLSIFHPEADTDPPRTVIQNLAEGERNVPEGGTINLSFAAVDKWRYTPRYRLLYSYRLDEGDWSAFQEGNDVAFTDLSPGKHYFQVRSMDRNGNVESEPVRLQFAVVLPWYRESRLVLILGSGLALALFFAGLAFNRHLQLRRSYAAVELKVAERTKELELANRELVHSQKMNALGTLAAGIAHDFNNILSIVKGSAQIIEDNLENPTKIRTRVDRIKTVVEQGAGIVKAMLGFSRQSGQETGSCDLNDVVEDTLKLLGDRFLREVEIRFEPGANLPQINASRDWVQQILLNFIFNAAESMAQRKEIILRTRQMEKLPPALFLAPASSIRYLSCSVQDFGCGIPNENLPRIFEPFFTTKAMSTRRGTGLGLSMAYELARRMEAGLAVESLVGQGSTFALILPLKNAPSQLKPSTYEASHSAHN